MRAPGAGTRTTASHSLTGDAVARLDISNCCATLESGRVLAFDRCVMATGSDPIRLRVPGHELPGVMHRSLADIAALNTAPAPTTPAVVIGGGLLGLEAAYGLARAGSEGYACAFNGPADGAAAGCAMRRSCCARRLETKGIECLLGRGHRRNSRPQRTSNCVELKVGRSIHPAGSSSWPSASVPTPLLHRRAVSRSSAGSWSTTARNQLGGISRHWRMRRASRPMLRLGRAGA